LPFRSQNKQGPDFRFCHGIAMMRTSSVRNFLRLAMIAMAFCLAKWAAPTFSMAPIPVDSDMEMSFGKHRGRLISEIVEEDPSYLQWLLSQTEEPDASGRLLEVAEYVREYFPEVEGTAMVSFGKYRGMALSQLVKEDPDYCGWILDTAAQEDAGHLLQQAAKWIKENHPDLQVQIQQSKENVDGDTVVTFGKHKGLTFKAVLEDYEEYLCWVINTFDDDARGNKAALLSFAKQHASC